MIGEITLAVLSFFTGMAIPKILGLHKCKYKIIFNRTIHTLPFTVSANYTSREQMQGHKVDPRSVFVTCKECSICQARKIIISDGTQREFGFNKEFVMDIVESEILKEKEKADRELFDRVDGRFKPTPTPEEEAHRLAMMSPPSFEEKSEAPKPVETSGPVPEIIYVKKQGKKVKR